MATLTDMMSKFVSANTASSSGSGTLPGTKVTKDQVQTLSSQNTAPIQPLVIQSESQAPFFEPVVAPVSAPMPNLKPSIPYPSRRDNEKRRDQANEQIEKFYEIFKDMSFEISFTDALILMPKFASTLKALIGNKEKLTDFVVVDFKPDPRVPLILGRCFLKTSQALIDVHKGELTLPITYNLDQTVRYFANYNQMKANKIDVVELACEEYSQEEADAFLGLEDDPDSSKINPFYYGPKGDILLLEAILNSEPSPPLPNQDQNLPSFKEELKAYEAQTVKSSGINLEFYTHKILMEEDYKPAMQHQRWVNPKIHDVIKKEVEKHLDAGLIYPISDSPWVSP
nr:reverse transcriptase domain-containing protein [Tanacetum cinerariifolium]